MVWSVCFGISVCTLFLTVLLSIMLTKTEYKRNRIMSPFNIFFGGLTISALLLFIPVYLETFLGERYCVWKVLLLALHNTIRLFIVDGEFSIITESIAHLSQEFAAIYSLYAAIIFVIAPFLTFGVVLSFFKNVSAYKDYFFHYFSEAFIFSELNEQSLALAQSLKQNDKKRVIVFNDVFVDKEEVSYELAERAHAMGAITFKRDIAAINFGLHSKQKNIYFFVIGQNDDEKIKQTLSLLDKYKQREHVWLYLFSTSVNSELLLNTAEKGKIKVRRVNEVQSLINRLLYDDGMQIFESAQADKNGEKLISAVVLGMGLHGTEMTKALSWFCQMDGYRVNINAFEENKNAESRFCALCPELMDAAHNDMVLKGEAQYKIKVHSGVDVETKKFLDMLQSLEQITYIFVALGDDEKNIRTAIRLRSWLAKFEMFPQIDAIVYNPEKKEALEGIVNYSAQSYDINFIGDIGTSYSEEVIFESDIEAIALQRHLKWGEEEAFWQYEYNYRSSVASAIHRKMKIECHIPGADKPVEQRTEEEKWNLRELEHRRWNAYMRAEGYTFAKVRNNLAKTHHCLIPFDELPLKEQEKDDD